jgi:hypothetical protein
VVSFGDGRQFKPESVTFSVTQKECQVLFFSNGELVKNNDAVELTLSLAIF